MKDIIGDQIKMYAKQLKLPAFCEYDDVIRQADTCSGFDVILLELMKRETERRNRSAMEKRFKQAGFPYEKTLDEFDMKELSPNVSKDLIGELASCKFINEHRNVIMVGNPGRGKTHLSIALGMKACKEGYKVLFRNAATLSTQLVEAKDTYILSRLQKYLASADLLIIDELSYISFNRHQSELLFQVISDRTEKKSTIVTTNLMFSQWTELFESDIMVNALVDRLTYHSYVMNMNGRSYRLEKKLTKKKGTVDNTDP